MKVMYQAIKCCEGEQLLKTTASGAKIYQAGCDGAIGCFTLFDGNRNYVSIGFYLKVTNLPQQILIQILSGCSYNSYGKYTLNFLATVAIQ